MKREKISNAIGNISSRYIEEAAEFGTEERPSGTKGVRMRRLSLVASFLVAVTTVFVISGMLGNYNGRGNLPTDIENIIWKTDDFAEDDIGESTVLWNEFLIDTYLYDALQNSSGEYIAIVMTKADGQEIEKSKYSEIVSKAEYNDYKEDTVYLFLTKDEFLNLKIENKSDYVFHLAARSSYE